MARETMTSKERVEAVLHLEKPDRVPVVPSLMIAAASHLAGVPRAQTCADLNVAIDALFKVYDDFGGWDALWIAIPDVPKFIQLMIPMRIKVPGIDLPDNYVMQFFEEEILKPEDYDKIAEMGWFKFHTEDSIFRVCDATPEDITSWAMEAFTAMSRVMAEAEKRGVSVLLGAAAAMHPFFGLSLGRSMVKFTEDLYYSPKKVERALKRMTADFIQGTIDACKATGTKVGWCVEERASAFYYPLWVFERFWWPYTVQIVDAMWSEGLVTQFHMDTQWDKNIPYFKKLPRGSYVLELDSTTDIFAAKEVVRGHGIIHGDVPAALESLGKPEDVEAYVKKLIDEVGGDGGFILGDGCSTAADVKPENFRAMLETGKNYEFSKK
jgi:uroporphyrinogen-III decarboxylase